MRGWRDGFCRHAARSAAARHAPRAPLPGQGPGQGAGSPGRGRDVAEGIVRALEKEGNVGERYLLVAENLTFGEINGLLTEITGARPPRLTFPDWMTIFGALCATGVADLTKKPPMLDMAVDQMRLMKQGFEVDGSKATRELGLSYTPIRTVLEEAVAS